MKSIEMRDLPWPQAMIQWREGGWRAWIRVYRSSGSYPFESQGHAEIADLVEVLETYFPRVRIRVGPAVTLGRLL